MRDNIPKTAYKLPSRTISQLKPIAQERHIEIIRADAGGYQLGHLVVDGLPPRQAQILLCCAHGMKEKEAAAALNCTASNINAIKQTLFYKFGANSTPELITKAFMSNFLVSLVEQ